MDLLWRINDVVATWRRFIDAMNGLLAGNMRSYWHRPCMGIRWRRRFPASSTDQIRSFLYLFVDAFGYSKKRSLCFSPDDRLMDIYRTEYPSAHIPDAMELERLSLHIEKQYGVDIDAIWHDQITLGEIYQSVFVSMPSNKAPTPSENIP